MAADRIMSLHSNPGTRLTPKPPCDTSYHKAKSVAGWVQTRVGNEGRHSPSTHCQPAQHVAPGTARSCQHHPVCCGTLHPWAGTLQPSSCVKTPNLQGGREHHDPTL